MPSRNESGRVDAKALGEAVGVFWAMFVVFVGIASRFGWGTRWEVLLEDTYPGYNESGSGLVVGGILGFCDGFFDAYLIGKLYNWFSSSA